MRSLWFLSLGLTVALLSVGCLAAPWQLPKTKHPFSQRECTMCRFSVSLVNYALKTQKGAQQVRKIADSFCKLAHLESPVVCSNVTRLFENEVVKVLAYGLVTPNQVCGLLSNNTCGHYQDPMADWEVNLNASANLDQNELRKVREALERQEAHKQQLAAPAYRIIHISDTHVDMKYNESSVSNCDEPLCCHEASKPLNSTEPVKAGHWGSYTNCDVPLRTFESALKQLNHTIASSSDSSIPYIIWTGDIQPHDVWEQDKKSALKTYDAVFAKIFEYLPGAKIFPTFGNHEMVPVDSFSPSNLKEIAREDSPDWIYRKLDSYWSRWLPSDTVKTITKDGFYAVSLGNGLKIVSLNTNFCHNKNFWLYINSTDPGNQLQWLVHELQISELEHEKVHIVGHIPPGTVDCLKVWSRNYNKIVRRFAQTISGQFFGHTHNNEFEIFYDQADAAGAQSIVSVPQGNLTPISVGFIGPSVTTFIGLNPSFRIYTIDPSKGFMPTDFETHYMNLTAANQASVDQTPEWRSTGSFSKLFGISDVSPLSMHNLLVDVVKELKFELDAANLETLDEPIDTSSNGKLLQLYRVYNSYSDVMTEAKFDKISANAKREFLCKFFTSQSHDRFACDTYIGKNANASQIDPIGVL